MDGFPWGGRLLLMLLGLSACGDNDTGPGDLPPASATVEVGNDFFRSTRNGSTEPAFDTVAVNGTVTWTWVEVGHHGVTFDNGAFPTSEVLDAVGSQHSVTFPAAGTFDYTCSIHGPQMAGSIVVR